MTSFAFLFPGQGSQAVGMLDAWGDHPAVRDTLVEASAALGEDVARLIREGPKDALDLTTNTQPVMLTAGIACYRAWRAEGGAEPAAVAGHSLGEYTALVAAGALALADALPLVRFRAQAMQEAVPVGTGAMAAILGLDAQAVREGCTEAAAASGEVVEAVNFNDPKQTVIAGSKAGVEKGCEVLKARGAKRTLPLPVSAPFHSSLMKPAAERLREKLASVAITAPRSRWSTMSTLPSRPSRGNPRCALSPGFRRGALGRGGSGAARARLDPVDRVRARQGAGRHGQAHRCRGGDDDAVRPGHAGRSQGPARMNPLDAGPGRAGHGRFSRHRAGDRPCLAAQGAAVIGTATSEAGAAGIDAALAAQGGRGIVLDVNDGAALDAAVDAIVKQHGALHILVNNAGITRDTLAMRMKDDDWDAVLDTNLKAVFRASRAAMRTMMKQRYGRIVNITSVVGAAGNAGQANYAAAKAGVAGMTRALARELGSRSVTVNCVAPGFIATDMTDGLPEAQKAALLAQIPLGRLGSPQEVADAVSVPGFAGCRLYHRHRTARQRRHVHALMFPGPAGHLRC